MRDQQVTHRTQQQCRPPGSQGSGALSSHPLHTDRKVTSWVLPSTQTTPRKARTGAHMASVHPEARARPCGLESTHQMPKEATWGLPVPSEAL